MLSVTSGFSNALLDFLPKLGVRLPESLLRQLEEGQRQGRLPLFLLDALWLELERQTPEGAGFLIGQQFKPEDYDLLGLLLMSCRSIEQAAMLLVRYSPLIGEGGVFSIKTTPQTCNLIYTANFKAARRFRIEVILTAMLQGTRRVVGDQTNPVEVHFQHDGNLEAVARLAVFAPAKVCFNQPNNALVFLHEDWVTERRRVNPQLRQQMVELADAQLRQLRPESWLDEVTQALQKQPWLTRLQLASVMHVSERHLNRLLGMHGLNYRQLADEVRKSRCLDLMLNSQTTQTRLSEYFGYSDESAFAKAFKRWFGEGFQAVRRKIDQGDQALLATAIQLRGLSRNSLNPHS